MRVQSLESFKELLDDSIELTITRCLSNYRCEMSVADKDLIVLKNGVYMNDNGEINLICGSRQYIEEYGNTVIWEGEKPKLY